jgi:NtrC-family two-component system response regulator AlgB
MRVLIVDDEPNIRRTLRVALEASGHTVAEASSGAEARDAVERRPCDVALVDLRLASESGLDLLGPLLEQLPRLAIIIITAHASIDTAVEAMRRGAFDYLPKPFTPAQVRAVLERVERLRGLRDRVAELEDRVRREVPEVELQGRDPQVRRLLDLGRRVAPTDAAVLIRGESGTGKGVLAHTLHAWSGRSERPFVTVSCPSLSSELLESDLFGHVRGAFTGADRDRVGRFEQANGGTLFLDEIGDINLEVQTKLLRVLQEMSFERVGSSQPIKVDVRILAATHQDLEAMIRAGRFREDLYYRINVFSLRTPPLRERKEDIFELAVHFLGRHAQRIGKAVTHLDDEAVEALIAHDWPGNIRELENVIERAVVLADGPAITRGDLPTEVRQPTPPRRRPRAGAAAGAGAGTGGGVGANPAGARSRAMAVASSWDTPADIATPVEEAWDAEFLAFERQRLTDALGEARGNQSEAARLLGMPRSTLCSKLEKHGLLELPKELKRKKHGQ